MFFTQCLARASAATIASACWLLSGCVTNDGSGEFYTDWDRAGGCLSGDDKPWGVSLAGKPLGPCAYRGSLVWISYDALWCRACASQAEMSSAAAREEPPHTVFMWVLTGGSKANEPAAQDELRRWAARFSLDPEFVVSEGATSRVIPQHALIGPDGRTWFRYVGLMKRQEILDTIDAFRLGKRQPTGFR